MSIHERVDAALARRSLTLADVRGLCDEISDWKGDWQGLPVPVEGLDIVLHRRHPLYDKLDKINGKRHTVDDDDPLAGDRCVNRWRSRARQSEVFVCRRKDTDRAYVLVLRLPPDGSMQRLLLQVNIIGATDAWDLDAEQRAREKLRGMLSDRQWRHYELTGSFLETSPRSRVSYLFRRSRPTIAMSPRWGDGKQVDSMRCLAVLCLHPVGYYNDSWAGCMVPSDDVIAHLIMMRADEAHYWSKANQHDPASPEAGL